MSEPTTYALPAEPDGPVWDRYGSRWDRGSTGLWDCEDGTVVGREWHVLLHFCRPLTSAPPWKPVVGGIVETEERYAALPEGSVVCIDNSSAVHVKATGGIWYIAGATSEHGNCVISGRTPRTILRVGWSL